jgi:hypothetical protein
MAALIAVMKNARQGNAHKGTPTDVVDPYAAAKGFPCKEEMLFTEDLRVLLMDG